ncbi:MAG: cyclase family protein [Corynebacterium sp.]|nr:cyclase family protein [Corynebacterium sp.]
MLTELLGRTLVDLTHPFHPGIPCFPGDPDERRRTVRPGVTQYELIGQWGTHVDAPAHFIETGRTLDQIPVTDMIAPLVVVDFADVEIQPADLRAWEAMYCRIPLGAFVALRTGWSQRWPNPQLMGDSAAPGWSVAAIDWLVTQRDIVAIGHETLDTDPGFRVAQGELIAQRRILAHDRWQIERMAHLDQLPATGALVVAAWPKPLGGTGFPARIFAVI